MLFCPVSIAHNEFGRGEKVLIIDAAEIAPGEYEVMAFYRGGSEIECYRTGDPEDAKAAQARMVEQYAEDAIARLFSPKMQNLVDALKAACAAAHAAREQNSEDGGTCNFDSPAIRLFRWRQADIEACANAVCLTVRDWNLYGTRRWVFGVPGPCGQANLRSRMAEAMVKSLKESGFDAMDYAQLD